MICKYCEKEIDPNEAYITDKDGNTYHEYCYMKMTGQVSDGEPGV